MSYSLSILSIPLHNLEVDNLNILFGPSFNICIADYDLFNKYIIYKFNQYAIVNIKDYGLLYSIQIDFTNFEAKYFDELNNTN